MPQPSILPLAAVLISAVATALIVASYRYPNVRESWSVLAALAKFGVIASMLPGILDGEEYVWSMQEQLGVQFLPGIDFVLRADPLGMLFATLASFLWIFTAFYTAGYMRGLGEHAQTRFFAAFAASLSTAVGIAFAGNLVTIFLFYELLSVATYPLVAHDETEEARIAGRKYLAYTFFGGGVLVLGGTVLTYWLTGLHGAATVTFGETAAALAQADPIFAQITFAMLALGFGVKAAIMPLHSWLPDAMVAPTPVSGLLHAVAVVKSGAFGVARVVIDVFGLELTATLGMATALAALAAFTLLASSVIALRKDNLKRRLAYSTVSQLSYIVLGIALGAIAFGSGAHPRYAAIALAGGLLHIPAHAFMKLTLFFCAGAIHVETHTDDISDMAGIGKRMPLTLSAFAIAAAGMAGIPLVAGFVSKFYMLVGASADPAMWAFAAALVVSGVFNVAYFWPVVYQAFFESEDAHDAKPLVEFPIGGKRVGDVKEGLLTDGGTPEDDTDADEGLAVDAHPSDADVPFGVGSDDAEASDGPDGHDDHTDNHDGHHDDDHHHHGGPPEGGWVRHTPWTESTWLMLMPITVIVTGAVALGIVPDHAVFLDVVEVIAEAATGAEVAL